MKTFFLILLVAGLAVLVSPATNAQAATTATTEQVGQTVSDSVNVLPASVDQTKAEAQFSIIDFIIAHQSILLGLLLALSEVLSLIPGISQNGIFQAIFSWLKRKNKAG